MGGTKIEIVALDAGGETRLRRRIDTPLGDYGATLEAMASLVEAAEGELGARGTVGVAMPGAVSQLSGRIKNANSTWLNERALKEDFEARLAREVRFANDANCFALSEARDGAGGAADVLFGVILGTGVGGGVVVHGRVLAGVNSIAGEWGHNALPLPAASDRPLPLCYCGRRGCIEAYLSGPGLARDHARHGGEQLGPREITQRAEAGDLACTATLERYEARLARSLASVINILDPDVIVLGGGLSQLARLYENVPALWREHVFSDEVRTRLMPPAHGDASGARGAAWLWENPLPEVFP